MRRLTIALAAVALLAGGCGSKHAAKRHATKALPPSLARLFEYDHSAPLAVRDNRAPLTQAGVTIRDLSFRGGHGRRVNVFLVVPTGSRRHLAGVIYQHGSGQDRTEFATEAVKLARRGVVAVLLDEPWVRSNLSVPRARLPFAVRDNYVNNVIDVRRAVDLLQARKDVDGGRIGFLGHSYGAAIGAIASGVEKRFAAIDILSGGGTPSRGYAAIFGRTRAKRAADLQILLVVDPVLYVGYAAPTRLFIQAGEHDELIPHPDLVSTIRAASKPKKVRWYNAGHALTRAAFDDSAAWLARELRVK
jgi:predicted esterase